MILIYPLDITQPATKKRKARSRLMRKKRKVKSKFMTYSSLLCMLVYPLDVTRPIVKKRKVKSKFMRLIYILQMLHNLQHRKEK